MQTLERNINEGQSAILADLGKFEGFNFRENAAITRILTAEEVVHWNHDADGEAEFWPHGDHAGVALIFKNRTSVTGRELVELDRLLQELGDDSMTAFVRIHHAVNVNGCTLEELTRERIEDQMLHIYEGTSFYDLRREAAFELFELYHPEVYRVWDSCRCDGLHFDTDDFLDSPGWSVEEIECGNFKAVIVEPQ